MDQTKTRKILIISAVSLLVIGIVIYGLLGSKHSQDSSKQTLDRQQQAFAKSVEADPIFSVLPYYGDTFNIIGTIGSVNKKATIILRVEIVLTGADLRASDAEQQALVNTYEQQALDYIKSKGFDPSKYQIEYTGF